MTDYRLTQIQELHKLIEETKTLLNDPSLADMAVQEINQLEEQKKQLEESIKDSQEKNEESFDERNVILEVKGAAGGDEAKLWADELLRMYTRFAQQKGFQVEQLEEN